MTITPPAAAAEVAHLYEQYPFPSPRRDAELIEVVAAETPLVLADGALEGLRVLDAGCGTGHTLVGMARRFPTAHFTGLDMCARSLGIARDLAERHGVHNVEFRLGAMPDADLPDHFDYVICFGVLHHLPDPAAGLAWLTDRLADDGLLHMWLYHSVGERNRMLDRELARLLAPSAEAREALPTVRMLGLRLSLTEYGFPAGWTGTELDESEQDVFDADAYLNPIVHTYRFGDLPGLCARAGLDWLAADRVYGPRGVHFVDLGGTNSDRSRYARPEDLLDHPELRERLAEKNALDRLRALELVLRPTGFRVMAGRGDSLARCVPRLRKNLLPLPAIPAPDDRKDA
jgi:SAM-dependent methyltransferase